MKWTLRITRSAQKEMSALEQDTFERIDRAILKLRTDPHCRGARKLKGFEGYRLRVGKYRVLYDINKKDRTVTIYSVRHRREAYR